MEGDFTLVSKRITSSRGSSGDAIESQACSLPRARALTHVRVAMQRDVPDVFSGSVEVDETYLGGQWKNKRYGLRLSGSKRGRGTSKTPVFGILCRGDKVWAQIVPDVEAKTLLPLITNRVESGSTVYSDTWKSYTGVAAKGYVHRLVEHQKGEYV